MKCNCYKYFLLFVCSLLFPANVLAEARVALVIGNAEYDVEAAKLDNSVNDAMDVASVLETMDFDVILRTDQGVKQLNNAIREFGDRLQVSGKDTVGLFYYAGHAAEVEGVNYIYPIDAQFKSRDEAAYEAVQVQRLLGKMKQARNNMNVIILDACRDNPYGDKTRSIGKETKKLAEMEVPVGSIVAYSTASGQKASDGNGRNGLYTQELLRYIKQPGMQIEDVFKKVRRSVRQQSGNAQVAWEHSSLEGDFYFLPPVDLTQTVQEKTAEGSDNNNISISSNTRGAQVFVNGKLAGVSPLVLGDLEEGNVVVKLLKEGFEPIEKQVLVRKSRSIELNFILKQQPMAYLAIKSTPADAEWYLDGVMVGMTPDRMDRVKFGEHEVSVIKQGYHPWKEQIDLDSADLKTLDVELQPIESLAKEEVVVQKQLIAVKRSIIRDTEFSPEMIVIPVGKFDMGDGSGVGQGDELPVHSVSIAKGFAIGKYEITFDEYDYFVKESGHQKPDDFGFGRGKIPVINVSWEDAMAYTKWLSQKTGHSYRLPSEAEWEYVARSGKSTPRSWTDKEDELAGDSLACQNANIADASLQAKKGVQDVHQCDDSYANVAPVGSFKPNDFGLYDLLGNVAEWTGSFYSSPYKGDEMNSDKGDVWSRRSVRGGSWSSKPSEVTSSARAFQAGGAAEMYLGFRVVREVEENQLSSK